MRSTWTSRNADPAPASRPDASPPAATSAASPSTSERTSPRVHALRAQHDVLAPALQDQAEHEDPDHGCAHQQREERAEVDEAVDVEGGQARLVVVRAPSRSSRSPGERALPGPRAAPRPLGRGPRGCGRRVRARKKSTRAACVAGRVGGQADDQVGRSREAGEAREQSRRRGSARRSRAACRERARPGHGRRSRARDRPRWPRRRGPRADLLAEPPARPRASRRRRTSRRAAPPRRTSRGRSRPDRSCARL